MEYETKKCEHVSSIVIGFEIEEAILSGWRIDPELPLIQVAFNGPWEVGFIRPKDGVYPAKMTPQERAAKMREVKEMKRKLAQQQQS
jgi:hypothetical protein